MNIYIVYIVYSFLLFFYNYNNITEYLYMIGNDYNNLAHLQIHTYIKIPNNQILKHIISIEIIILIQTYINQ